MFKKLGTAALAAAITLLGFQAVPAQADPLDAVAESISRQSANVRFNMTSSTQTLPSGASSANFDRSWQLKQSDLTGHEGEALSIVGSITKPDGSVIQIDSANINSGKVSVSLNIYTNAAPVSNNYRDASITVPASGFTGGQAQVTFYVGGSDINGNATAVDPGTYTFDASLKIGTTVVSNGTAFMDPWYLNSNYYSVIFSGASFTAPAGASIASYSTDICIDSSKLSVGATLTATTLINGASPGSNPNVSWSLRGQTMGPRNGSGNTQNTTVVTQADIDSGLTAYYGFGTSVTSGQTYSATYQIVDGNNANVTGSCAPAKAAKPTLTFTNGSFNVSGTLAPGADSMSSDCELFDAAAPTVVVASKSNVFSMGPSGFTCSFSAGLVTGNSYFAKVRGGYGRTVKGPWSDPSDSVVKPAAGYNFTTPISGINNEGGKLSLVSSSIDADQSALQIISSQDGANGLYLLAANSSVDQFGGTIVTDYKIRHITATGADSAFGGTGSITVTPGADDFVSNGRIGWYGSKDKFVLANSNFPMTGGSEPQLQITTGSTNSATVTKTTVASSVLTSACVSAVGAGYVSTQPGGMQTPASVFFSIISAPTSSPLIQLSCFKSYSMGGGMTSNLSIPVLVTITDATTVNVVKALGTPGANVNVATSSFSVNSNAGANDAAVTVFARTALQTGSGSSNSTTDARTIYTIKKDLTVSTLTSTWNSVATEPSVRLAPLNDGTIWGYLQEGQAFRLIKLVGDTLTQTDIALDTAADFTTTQLSFPNGIQPGNSSLLTLIRQFIGPSNASAQATLDTTTGALTTYEVAKFSLVSGSGVALSYFVDSKNLYWLMTTGAAPTKYSIYRWRDPAYVAQVAVNQTISWTTSPTTIAVGATAAAAASSTSNLPVTYGSSDVSKCTVNASTGVVTAVAAGTCTITADQAGNDGFNAAAQKTLTITITAAAKTAQTITWTMKPTSVAVGGTTTVAATASSSLAVSYSSTDATKCTVNEATGVVTAVAASGTCTIKANQAGNANYSAAPQQLHAINIAAVVPVKKTPKVPTIATKVKAGKTFVIALHATKGTAKTAANLDGLVAKVVLASSSKGYCSITPLIKSKKIAGYTVKGLKVNATKCAVTITITGNALFNTLTKTVKVNVTK